MTLMDSLSLTVTDKYQILFRGGAEVYFVVPTIYRCKLWVQQNKLGSTWSEQALRCYTFHDIS